MPGFYGSIRTCCAAATELNGFIEQGIKWGDRKHFRWSLRLILIVIQSVWAPNSDTQAFPRTKWARLSRLSSTAVVTLLTRKTFRG